MIWVYFSNKQKRKSIFLLFLFRPRILGAILEPILFVKFSWSVSLFVFMCCICVFVWMKNFQFLCIERKVQCDLVYVVSSKIVDNRRHNTSASHYLTWSANFRFIFCSSPRLTNHRKKRTAKRTATNNQRNITNHVYSMTQWVCNDNDYTRVTKQAQYKGEKKSSSRVVSIFRQWQVKQNKLFALKFLAH